MSVSKTWVGCLRLFLVMHNVRGWRVVCGRSGGERRENKNSASHQDHGISRRVDHVTSCMFCIMFCIATLVCIVIATSVPIKSMSLPTCLRLFQ